MSSFYLALSESVFDKLRGMARETFDEEVRMDDWWEPTPLGAFRAVLGATSRKLKLSVSDSKPEGYVGKMGPGKKGIDLSNDFVILQATTTNLQELLAEGKVLLDSGRMKPAKWFVTYQEAGGSARVHE